MRYSTQIRPISYLKANAAEVLQVLEEQRKPMIITQNGEAKAVIQDVASYEETQETLALLKILALGNQQVDRVLERLTRAADALRTSPDRGSNVNELRSLGISEYRQVFFKPYRLIYKVHAKQVIVYVVADGRRDMGSLLARRLLGA